MASLSWTEQWDSRLQQDSISSSAGDVCMSAHRYGGEFRRQHVQIGPHVYVHYTQHG